jgi:serine/threonine protein kinase
VDSRRPRTLSKPNLADLAAKARASAIIGTVISGRYRVIELLAMGGVGAVYLAEHVHMQKHVAVKVLHPDTQGLPDLVPRFEREAVAGAHIQHPNVAAATDFGELEDGSFFLVLEYVRGTTLREIIRRGPVPAARVIRIGRQIAAALGAAHAMGIVHRDVKPRNVMLIEGERDLVKLIDFGLAKLDLKQVSAVAAGRASLEDQQRITTSGAVFGTIAYLAPEAALGMDTVDARADLYALGLVLYELLAGKHPFDTSDPVDLFRQHHKVKPPPIAERTPGVFVPAALEAVVMRLLEKLPEGRFESAEATSAALDAALDVSSPTVPPVHLGGATPIFPGPSILPPPPSSLSSLPPPPLSAPPGPPSTPAPAFGPPPAAPSFGPPPSAVAAPVAGPSRRWPYAVIAVLVVALGGVGLAFFASADHDGGESVTSPPAPRASASPTSSPPSAAPSPAPPPVPTAAESAPASPPPPSATATAAPPGFDAAATRTLLRRTASDHDWVHATEAFFLLADHDPTAFHDPLFVAAGRDVAAASAVTGGAGADRVFEALSKRLGADGIDVLYEIVRTRGGSRAAVRAQELLAQSDVLARASPELRITLALRETPCAGKPALLDRAAAEGDARTLVVMETIAAACLGRSKALDDARTALKLRLRPH